MRRASAMSSRLEAKRAAASAAVFLGMADCRSSTSGTIPPSLMLTTPAYLNPQFRPRKRYPSDRTVPKAALEALSGGTAGRNAQLRVRRDRPISAVGEVELSGVPQRVQRRPAFAFDPGSRLTGDIRPGTHVATIRRREPTMPSGDSIWCRCPLSLCVDTRLRQAPVRGRPGLTHPGCGAARFPLCRPGWRAVRASAGFPVGLVVPSAGVPTMLG